MILKLDYSYLLKYRTALMGFCIIWVYFFHVTTKTPLLDPLTQIGWCGVDCFFVLSGIGLSHSLNKDNKIGDFYKRRVLRILPTWWFLIFGFHMINLLVGRPCPRTISHVLLYYSGIGWFFNACFDVEKLAYSEWYVPTLILFYLISPWFNRVKIKNLLIYIFIFISIGFFLSYYHIVDSLKLSYFRFPSFILGFVIYKMSQLKDVRSLPIYVTTIVNIVLFIIGILCLFVWSDLSLTTKHPDSVIESLGAIMIVPGILQLISTICRIKIVDTILNSFGKVSLELYLLHVYFIAIAWRMRSELPIPDTLSLIFALGIYWIMSWCTSIIVKYLKSSFKYKVNG